MMSTSATSFASPSRTPPPPLAPKFGGVVRGNAVLIGGPPLADFSGTSYKHMATPFCIRGLDPGNEIKSYKSRVEDGNHIKFKKLDEDYPLVAFADDCLRHMQQHGLDVLHGRCR